MAAALVERDRELAAIAGTLDSPTQGSGGVLLIEGEAGIGKTRLLAEARAAAESRGMRRLRARAAELERPFAFGVIRQLLEPELRNAGAADRILTGAAAAAAPVLGGPAAHSLPPQDLSSALLHGIYWTCVHLSEEQPTAADGGRSPVGRPALRPRAPVHRPTRRRASSRPGPRHKGRRELPGHPEPGPDSARRAERTGIRPRARGPAGTLDAGVLVGRSPRHRRQSVPASGGRPGHRHR